MNRGGFAYWLTAQGYSAYTLNDSPRRVAFIEKHYGLEGAEKFVVECVKKKWKHNSINCYLKALNLYFKYVGSKQHLKLLKPNGSAKATFTKEELKRFLEIRPKSSNHCRCNFNLFWNLVALTGARPIEITRLTMGDISFAEGLLYFNETKTGEARKVPIPTSLVSELSEYANSHGEPLFPANPQTWGKNFHYRLKCCGINRPQLKPYSLRSTAATMYLNSPGAVLYDVMSLLGHHSSETTRIYYNLDGERLKKLVAMHPLQSEEMSIKQKARNLCDLIRSLGIEYEPTTKKTREGIRVEVTIRGSPATVGGSPAAAKHRGNPQQ